MAISLALAILLAFLLWQEEQESKARQAYLTQYTAQLNPLYHQKNQLQSQLTALEREYTAQHNGAATLILLVTELDETVYTQVYPQLQAAGCVATLALSPNALPGMEGCISVEDFSSLLAEGWSACVAWDGETPLEDWLLPVRAWLEEHGQPMPTVLLVEQGRYSEELDAKLLDSGFATVLHHGEDGLPIVTTDTDGEPWRVGACGWLNANANNRTVTAVNTGGSLALTVGSKNREESYDPEQFPRMLERLTALERNDQLIVTDAPTAKAHHAEVEAERGAIQTEYETQKAALEAQLAEIEAEIETMEATWHWDF